MENTSIALNQFYSLDIEGMTCASCVSRVEKAISKLPGVDGVSVNLATEQANVRLSKDSHIELNDIIHAVEKTGYEAKLSSPRGKAHDDENKISWGLNGLSNVLISICLSIPLVIPMILMPFGIHWSLSPWWQLALATPIQFILGWRFYSAGFKLLRESIDIIFWDRQYGFINCSRHKLCLWLKCVFNLDPIPCA